MPKNPLFCNGEENEKVIRNPHAVPDHHQKLITSKRSPLAHAYTKFGQRPFPSSSVILFKNERMTERMTHRTIITFALLAEVMNAELQKQD